jgi:hypothetical protein
MKIEATVDDLLKRSKKVKPQTPLEVTRGLTIRRTQRGIPVVRVHYSANPQRDPEINPEWKQQERLTYSSQAAWDREQEIVDEAGGGELVFAETLIKYWHKIIISDPRWRPGPNWRVEAGFDHGRTNPTVFLRCYTDEEGVLYFCGEYYQPNEEIWQHVQELREMADFDKVSDCYADATIFNINMQQSQTPGRPHERAKSVNELYQEQGITCFLPFAQDRSDVSFAARLMSHWANLDKREPSVKIVCSNYCERPQPGLHNWDCPNLLWELMRARREKSTAHQLLTRNPSEVIVDKDNHARDAMKYVVMSHPEPTRKTLREPMQEITQPLAQGGDLTSAWIRSQLQPLEDEEDYCRLGEYFPMDSSRTPRWPGRWGNRFRYGR